LSVSTTSEAQEAKLTWVAPTQNEDGSTIPTTGENSLNGFKIYKAREISLVPNAAPVVVNDKTATTYTFTGLEQGIHYFAMSAYNVGGVESRLTDVVYKEIAGTPQSPNGMTIETTVYNVFNKRISLLLLPVGISNTNVPCNMSQSINGYNVVPRDQVTWSGTIKPDVVVAKCLAN